MSDLKDGLCYEHFWFNKVSCCWDSTAQFGTENCDKWKSWSQLLGVHTSKTAEYFVNYFFYVLCAFIFAAFTVVLVRFFAPYACGSGIPEVRFIIVFLMQCFVFQR